MGIFARLSALIKSNLNDMISRAEDPEKMLDQILEDMREQFAEAKKQVAVAIADEKRLKKQYENEAAQARSWEKKAMTAVQAGNDDLAKKALMRKVESQRLAAQFKEQWLSQKNAAEALKTALKDLNRKIEEAKRKRNLLIAKKRRAEAQKSIQKTMEGLSDSSAFSAYARMEDKIEQMAAEAEASLELTAEMAEADRLEQTFRKMEEEQAADSMLAELKAKMGLEPEQEAAEAQQTSQDDEMDLDAELAKMKAKLDEKVPDPA